MKVAEQNSGLRAGNDKDDEDQEQEAKHVIHLMRPDDTNVNTLVSAKTFILRLTRFSMA